MPATIPVHTSRGQYEVRIESGLLARTGAELRAHVAPPPARVAVVTDSNVAPLHLPRVMQSLAEAGFDAASHIFPAGEASKTLATAAAILDFLARERFTRTDLVLALGGGVVGDVAGFAAAIYLRGVRVVQVPTTFLAAIDSSVGGKTAVNIPAGKNLVGVFAQPAAVLCDPELLRSLPPDDFTDGCAEVVKYAFIGNRELLAFLREHDIRDDVAFAVEQSIRRKRDAVAADERDTGERQLLNLGHTIGHAVEMASGFRIRHGHAVAVGMVAAAEGAAALGFASENAAPLLRALLRRAGLPVSTPFPPDELLPYLAHDKKRSGRSLVLVLPMRPGESQLVPLDPPQVRDLVTRGLALARAADTAERRGAPLPSPTTP